MTYSSGIFANADTSLEEAQTEKYDGLCRNLKLKPGDRVLEIGSGWGGYAVHAAKNYGCQMRQSPSPKSNSIMPKTVLKKKTFQVRSKSIERLPVGGRKI